MPFTNLSPPPEARQGLEKIGLASVFDSYMAAADKFVQSEQAYRRSLRAGLAGLAPGTSGGDSDREAAANEAGLRHVGEARAAIARTRAELGPKLLRQLDETAKSTDFRGALGRARENFVSELLEENFDPEDFQQIVRLWDEKASSLMAGGFSRALDDLESTTDKLAEARRQPGRGRERSSLPWWKVLAVAGIILVSTAAVIACFIWFGCTWVVQYLSFVSPATLALIQQGCRTSPTWPPGN